MKMMMRVFLLCRNNDGDGDANDDDDGDGDADDDDDDDEGNPSVQEVTKCRRSRHRRTRNNG